MTNAEILCKNTSKMALVLVEVCENCPMFQKPRGHCFGYEKQDCFSDVKQWLESEVEE